jgi:hypothetical protein
MQELELACIKAMLPVVLQGQALDNSPQDAQCVSMGHEQDAFACVALF